MLYGGDRGGRKEGGESIIKYFVHGALRNINLNVKDCFIPSIFVKMLKFLNEMIFLDFQKEGEGA